MTREERMEFLLSLGVREDMLEAFNLGNKEAKENREFNKMMEELGL